ncbi:hypothetical protein HU200_061715 [Digitaria exilis]|uniref:Protein kinase domain-containing protein n=1 Tax=Digitaria exilis TaxID=1010633 RepID=A0A835AH36_9POAL|nr:hypothetical protein HU200_061715 [Digitaria exilis]
MGFFVAFWAAVATLLMLPSSFGGAAPAAAAATGPAGRNCTTSCGSISIQYPLGIEPGCYHGPGFNLTCASRGHGPPELFLGDGTVQLLEISVEHSTVRINSTSCSCCTMIITAAAPQAGHGGAIDHTVDIMSGVGPKALPATLAWIINNSTCPANKTAPECRSAHSYCQDDFSQGVQDGGSCRCSKGYEGNPYVPGGCQDIDECESPEIYVCSGDCKNTPGSFMCQCPTDFMGDPSVLNGCRDECEHPEAHSCYGICQNFPGSFGCLCHDGTYGYPFTKGGCNKKFVIGLSVGLGVGGGTSLLLLALGGPFIMRKIKLRKVKKMRHKFFKENHGLLLQQLISRNTDIGHRMIITLRDIEKATDNFDRARIVGGGGHGVVFKGILDLQVVAIKKSKIVVQREINEFINEVAVLSQVNHRNVVKLLGCCLETKVPLLVYEFISNGTLYNHLHIEGPVSLSWDDRLRISMEVAKALSYLHSSASMPIFHRDVKSSNILLNDALTAKVSDFGASRYIPMDQTGVVTAVQGTFGYLDPMYYYTGRLTDKSDVFSFGVVLVELLT